MSEDYMNGLKSLSSRPDIKNKSTAEICSTSEESADNNLDVSDSIEINKEINNNQSLKATNETEEINEASSDEGHDDKIDKKDDSSIKSDHHNENNQSVEKKLEDFPNNEQNLDMREKKNNNNNSTLIISVIVLIACIFCASKFCFKLTKIKVKEKQFRMDLIDELKNSFPSQSDWFWINIESSFKHSVLKSKDPSIVLIIYDEETTDTYSKLSKEILNYLSKIDKSKSHVVVSKKKEDDFRYFIEKNMPDESKFYIDSKLSTHFKSGGKLALVEDIHEFPAHSMVLFYAYGDEEKYAKFPGVLIFMSFKLNEKLDAQSKQIYSQSPKKLREFAENRMFNLWSKWIREDQLRPLFTRIANNVILVNSE